MSPILSECDCISRNIAIEFISAHANILKPQLHQCETIWLQKYVGEAKRQMNTGMSMATPAVGGAATLIVDYFQQGKFNGKNMSPVAPTVKAILVASCMPIKKRGYSQDLMWEGHGEVNLYNFLNVDNDPNRRMALGESVGIRDGQHLISKVKIETNSSLRIGLSYNIKPLSPESPVIVPSDVSIYVVSPKKDKKYWGNGKEEGATVNEAIVIGEDEIQIGEYEIHLICHSYFTDLDTLVSVVAVGGFNNDMELKFESCNNHGTCNSGMCACEKEYYGSACQFNSVIVEQNSFRQSIKLNPQTATKDYDVVITRTEGEEPRPYPSETETTVIPEPQPETSSQQPETPPQKPETSSSQTPVDPDPQPKPDPESESSSQSSPETPEQTSSGTDGQSASENSGEENKQNQEGGLSKSGLIAVSIIVPAVIIAAVILVVVIVVSRSKEVGYKEEIDI